MVEEERPLMLTNESINFGSLFGNITMHMPEESNRIFRYLEGEEPVEISRSPPERQNRMQPSSSLMIEEINVLAIKEVRYVNPKQWERMMKRRIKREMDKLKKMTEEVAVPPEQPDTVLRKYKYESRHLHAEKRQRNEKGRFVGSTISFNAARPKPSQEVVKKKRGRKSRKELEQMRLRQQLGEVSRNESKENDGNHLNWQQSGDKHPTQSTTEEIDALLPSI